MKLSSLSVLCLAYNEVDNVRWALPHLARIAGEVAEDYEIVIITHPNSDDGTKEAINEFAKSNHNVRYVDQPKGVRGYGPAFKFGLTQLNKDFAFHTDIDGQFNFDELPRAVELQQSSDADLVHFNRRQRQDPIERKIIGVCFKILVHTFYRCPVWDFDSAFNLFKTRISKQISLQSDSGMAVPEFMISFGRHSTKIAKGWTQHQPRRAGRPAWERPAKGIILPDSGIVLANLLDIWRLRKIEGSRFRKLFLR
jgi:glycosyltransferase involved in cell wall biosynthesis